MVMMNLWEFYWHKPILRVGGGSVVFLWLIATLLIFLGWFEESLVEPVCSSKFNIDVLIQLLEEKGNE
jgi:hypothetical protein